MPRGKNTMSFVSAGVVYPADVADKVEGSISSDSDAEGRYEEPPVVYDPNSLLGLPDEFLLEIFSRLSAEELLKIGLTNKKLNAVANDNALWVPFCRGDDDIRTYLEEKYHIRSDQQVGFWDREGHPQGFFREEYKFFCLAVRSERDIERGEEARKNDRDDLLHRIYGESKASRAIVEMSSAEDVRGCEERNKTKFARESKKGAYDFFRHSCVSAFPFSFFVTAVIFIFVLMEREERALKKPFSKGNLASGIFSYGLLLLSLMMFLVAYVFWRARGRDNLRTKLLAKELINHRISARLGDGAAADNEDSMEGVTAGRDDTVTARDDDGAGIGGGDGVVLAEDDGGAGAGGDSVIPVGDDDVDGAAAATEHTPLLGPGSGAS